MDKGIIKNEWSFYINEADDARQNTKILGDFGLNEINELHPSNIFVQHHTQKSKRGYTVDEGAINTLILINY